MYQRDKLAYGFFKKAQNHLQHEIPIGDRCRVLIRGGCRCRVRRVGMEPICTDVCPSLIAFSLQHSLRSHEHLNPNPEPTGMKKSPSSKSKSNRPTKHNNKHVEGVVDENTVSNITGPLNRRILKVSWVGKLICKSLTADATSSSFSSF